MSGFHSSADLFSALRIQGEGFLSAQAGEHRTFAQLQQIPQLRIQQGNFPGLAAEGGKAIQVVIKGNPHLAQCESLRQGSQLPRFQMCRQLRGHLLFHVIQDGLTCRCFICEQIGQVMTSPVVRSRFTVDH